MGLFRRNRASTTDGIVAGLKRTLDDLQAHAGEQAGQADQHAREAEHHSNMQVVKQGEADRALAIAANIGTLLGR